MKPPKALLLDLDGTLCDTLPDLADAVNHARARLGWRPMPPDAVRVHMGDGARELLMGCTGLDGKTVDMMLPPWREHYLAHCTEHTTLLPGARELLDAARARGIPAGVVTNKPAAPSERILEALGVRPLLGCVIGGGSTRALKPDPSVVHAALEALGGVAPADAWLVGDGPQDVEAARNAGAVSILVPGYGDIRRAREARPDVEVPDLRAVVAMLA
jgi:phosphoglycolate phosphatase